MWFGEWPWGGSRDRLGGEKENEFRVWDDPTGGGRLRCWILCRTVLAMDCIGRVAAAVGLKQ